MESHKFADIPASNYGMSLVEMRENRRKDLLIKTSGEVSGEAKISIE
jgi:hypothetical protein